MASSTPDPRVDASVGGPVDEAGAGAGGVGGDRAQYVVCAALAGLGILLLVDAARIAHVTSSNDPLGPRPVPMVLGVLLVVTAVLYTIDVARGGVGHAEEGEDVDLGARADWKTVGLLILVFGVNALLIDPLGWVISGTLLFWGSAFALGNRHHVRGFVYGLALALATFYAFAIGLGVNLPAGVLQGIL
jgi:putative tricarboxylic transport membrane protein